MPSSHFSCCSFTLIGAALHCVKSDLASISIHLRSLVLAGPTLVNPASLKQFWMYKYDQHYANHLETQEELMAYTYSYFLGAGS